MLENKEIKMRALEPSDAEVLYKWENDPANWKVSHTLTPYSRHTLEEYIHSSGDIYTDKQVRLIIERREDSVAIGAVDLFDCDFKNRRAGVGILIALPEARRSGFGSAVLEVLLPYCFHTLGLHQVYCNVLAENKASMSLFEKFGFAKAGLKKDWTVHNGIYYDEWLLQKIKDA